MRFAQPRLEIAFYLREPTALSFQQRPLEVSVRTDGIRLLGLKALASDQVLFSVVRFACPAFRARQQEESWHVIRPRIGACLQVSDGLGKVPAINGYLSSLPASARLDERGPGIDPAPIRRETEQTEYEQPEEGETRTAVK